MWLLKTMFNTSLLGHGDQKQRCVCSRVHKDRKYRCTKTHHEQARVVCEQVRYPEALNYFLSADVKAIKKTLTKSKPVHRMASCFMRMQKVRLMPAFTI